MTPDGEHRLLVSLVIPVLNEVENVEALARQFDDLRSANAAYDFKFVIVDDGSTDGTMERLEKAISADTAYAAVRLARNFGSHYAISAGLRHARGDSAVVLGADLQEPIDLVGRLLAEWAAGYEVVWGVRDERASLGITSPRSVGRLLAAVPPLRRDQVVPGRGSIRCAVRPPGHRRGGDDAGAQPQRVRADRVVGLPPTHVGYTQLPRNAGQTKWTRSKLAKLAIDSFIQFSTFPVKLMTWTGVAVASAGFLYAVVLVIRAGIGERGPRGGPPSWWSC